MVQVVAFVVLFKEAEAASVRILCRVDYIVWFIEIDLIIVAYNLTLRLSL